MKGKAQIAKKRLEVSLDGGAGAADQHIIPAGARKAGQNRICCGTQPSLGAIAGYGVADLLGTGISDAHNHPVIAPRARLKQEPGRTLTPRGCRAQKICAPCQHDKWYIGNSPYRQRLASEVRIKRHDPLPIAGKGCDASGGQFLATLEPARSQNEPAALGGHAGPKAVTAGANQVRGFKGALHRSLHYAEVRQGQVWH